MRVGINARYLYDGNRRGFNRYTACLVAALQEIDGFELILFTEAHRPLHPSFEYLIGPRVSVQAPAAPTSVVWEQVALPAALRRLRVDVFHAPADGGVPAWRSCPTVLTYHRALDKSVRHWVANGDLPGSPDDYGVPSGPSSIATRMRHDSFRRLYLGRADRIVTVSDFAKWELVSLLGVPETKIDAIPLAPDGCFLAAPSRQQLNAVRLDYGLPAEYFIYVGGFEPWKNIDGLLRAFAAARAAGLMHALVLVGRGDTQAITALAASLGLRPGADVMCLDQVGEDLPALYRGATAFVTLSWGESFSFPIVEAMACGVPVIAPRNSAIPEVLGDAGVQVDPRNPREAAQAMQSMAANPVWRDELRTRSAMRATAFSWRQTAERTAAVYARLLRPQA